MTHSEVDRLLAAARPLIDLGIAEDVGPGDATSEAILGPADMAGARLVAKAAGVIAGLQVARAVFRRVDPAVEFTPRVEDGQEVVPGELIAEVHGPAGAILAAERTALNFLQRMSGIATLTRRFVDAVACTRATVLDTRKTAPGYRVLDKYAVRMGGGQNHRMSLFDMILIKDNHVDAAGSIAKAVARARAAQPGLPVEVEVRDLDELGQALSIEPPVNRVLLDNMSLDDTRRAVRLAAGRVPLEVSGQVTLEQAGEIAATGVDYISVGALTHSAPALDMSLKVVRPDGRRGAADLITHVAELRARLGRRLVVLGHHYQRNEILAYADFRGDSLQLARDAARSDAEFIVCCGVHFMAETAAILARPGQHVLIPDPTAGCYLADTATSEGVQAAWRVLSDIFGEQHEVTPITYVNSTAALKAFCGRHGGIVCTSSNARRVLEWALSERPRVFFFPDQHLGRNTARQLGIPLEEILVWEPDGGLSADTLRKARVVLWPGACNVHGRFQPAHVRTARERVPGVRVLVHPECRAEVVALADGVGSTADIIRQVSTAEPGTAWAIGTETRLVRRLQLEHPDQRITSLSDVAPYCRTMGQITLPALAQLLEALAGGKLLHEVGVEEETAQWARLALTRMLEL
jgi:quinolinate synthase